MNKLTFASAFALFALTLTAPAQAETVNCTAITTLPYTITTQGVYCLTGHLSTAIASGNAIEITTNNVVLDLNGFKIGGLGAGLMTFATGIYASQRQNITIKNGTVRGFFAGIYLDDAPPYTTSQGNVIEDIRADQNTNIGMFIFGSGNIIRNNQVVASGGSTVNGANSDANGIWATGPGAQVLNNMVTDVAGEGAGYAYGIRLNSASNSVVAGNRVGNVTSAIGFTYGIYLEAGTNLIISDNRLSSAQYGIYFIGGATGAYMNNLVRGATTAAYTGGTVAGATNFTSP